jgi:Domain of unknown function (DUF1911)/Domain of unknown function (DUF1910)
MRDKVKTFSYFTNEIAEMEELIRETETEILEGTIDPERLESVKRFIFSMYIHLGISKYSCGMPISSIATDIRKSISMAEECWHYPDAQLQSEYSLDWYSKMVWMLSLANLLKFSENDIIPLLAILDKAKTQDWLLEYLVSKISLGRRATNNLEFPKIYASLKAASEETNPIESSRLMKRFLEKEWYKGYKDAYWHDNHKSKHGAYFGYWCFEAAAVVNISRIEDHDFEKNKFYPKDMLV